MCVYCITIAATLTSFIVGHLPLIGPGRHLLTMRSTEVGVNIAICRIGANIAKRCKLLKIFINSKHCRHISASVTLMGTLLIGRRSCSAKCISPSLLLGDGTGFLMNIVNKVFRSGHVELVGCIIIGDKLSSPCVCVRGY